MPRCQSWYYVVATSRLPDDEPLRRGAHCRILAAVPILDRIAVDRALSSTEHDLVRWLLESGTDASRRAFAQLQHARVSARCDCGCGCIDFRVEGSPRFYSFAGMEIVSDFWWRTGYGHLCGAFVFLLCGRLAGLDLWSIDGAVPPHILPQPFELWPYHAVSTINVVPPFSNGPLAGFHPSRPRPPRAEHHR